ncbi:unnamed protein product, partial [Ectocarpus fasciculatus]
QGKYAEADPLCIRAIEIAEKTLGPDHQSLAAMLNSRAELMRVQVRDQGLYLEISSSLNSLVQ